MVSHKVAYSLAVCTRVLGPTPANLGSCRAPSPSWGARVVLAEIDAEMGNSAASTQTCRAGIQATSHRMAPRRSPGSRLG
jgi:hypothetical protein